MTSLLLPGLILLGAATAPAQDLRIVEAAKDRESARIPALLRQGADVNAVHPDGSTALHWAAHWNDLPLADLLIRARANINAANEYGVTPLALAATNGSAAMVERLLTAGANPNATVPSGETVLMTASRTGNVDVVRMLLAHKADAGAHETVRGQTALMWAVAETHLDVVRTLIEAGADVRSKTPAGYTPMLFAARAGDIEVVRLLLAHGASVADTAADGSTPLLLATVRGHIRLAELLLDRGADPNVDGAGFTPLHWASGIWESLTSYDYRANTGEWMFEGLPQAEKAPFIVRLLKQGANVNARITRTPPRFGGRISRVLGPASDVGATPLWVAAASGDADTMQLLLANGADPLPTSRDNTTALMVASGMTHSRPESHVPEADYLRVVKMLLDLGADVNAVNAAGNTPLHGTAWAGFDAIATLLVERGARLNPKNKLGHTPLKVADGIVVAMQLHFQDSTAKLLRRLGGTI